MTAYDPWRDAGRRFAHIEIERHDIGDLAGAWVPEHKVIIINSKLSMPEARCTLAHELVHIDSGHRPTGVHRYDAHAEDQANRGAAHRLICTSSLARAFVLTEGKLAGVAAKLWVTQRMLDVRLKHLNDHEKAYIRRQVSRLEPAS